MCCRIAGTVNHPQSVTGSAILHMQSGGPDFMDWQQIDLEPNVVLGHARLSILDLSAHGNQPMTSYSGRYVMTYNGEVYNYKELGEGASDTRVILEYIDKVGFEQAVKSFNGMFALAVYDRVTKELHFAVDRFGQKPLYYYQEGEKFAFASAPAALYNLKDKWELDREALQSYWLLGSVMGEDSLLKGIKKLIGGYLMKFNCLSGRLEVSRYYEPFAQDPEYSRKHVKELVLDAIDKVKVSDVPIHIFLSGGIDSTVIASRFEGGQAVHLDSPELKYATEAADKFGINLKVVESHDIDIEQCMTDYVYKSGEPAMAALIPYIVSSETVKHGKVAITANGADELFFGYERTKSEVTDEQLKHIFRSCFWNRTHYNTFNYNRLELSGRKWELNSYLQYDLNKTLDFASMAHGLEVRSPFLDHRLVEMALSIPESDHRSNGNKTYLKQILTDLGFGKWFTERKKMGFSLHKKPLNTAELTKNAWNFTIKCGYLDITGTKLSERDKIYLKNSALSFYYWYQTWKHKIA